MDTPRKLTDKHGNLITLHRDHDDVPRLETVIQRLHRATRTLPGVRANIDDRIRDAIEAQGQGRGSGVADPVAAQAARVETEQQRHRAITRAVRSVEDAVEHLRVEAERGLGASHADEREVVLRCPKMVLTQQIVRLAHGSIVDEVLIRCDRLTAHHVDGNNNPIDIDPDGYCDEHRAEADEQMRKADDSNSRRLRRYRTQEPV